MKILFLAILLLSSSCEAAWTDEDIGTESVYQALVVVDWLQTQTIALHSDRFYEKNVFLGNHPSIDQINLYFLLLGIAHYFISDNLSGSNRKVWQYITIFEEVTATSSNATIGIRMNF